MRLPDLPDAACREQGIPTQIFFYEEDFPRRSREYRQAREIARRVCNQCPCRKECGEFAIETNQEGGMWGGMTAHKRGRIRKERVRLAQLQLEADLPESTGNGWYGWSR